MYNSGITSPAHHVTGLAITRLFLQGVLLFEFSPDGAAVLKSLRIGCQVTAANCQRGTIWPRVPVTDWASEDRGSCRGSLCFSKSMTPDRQYKVSVADTTALVAGAVIMAPI